MASDAEAKNSAELEPHERSRPSGQVSLIGGSAVDASTTSLPSLSSINCSFGSPKQAAVPSSASSSLYQSELQSAVRKQIQVLEDSVSSHLSGLVHERSRLREGSASATAALAAALEACVARLAESEAWIAAVDVEVRALRAESDRAVRTSAGLAAQIAEVAGHESSIRELQAQRPSTAHGRAGAAAWLPQRVEQLEGLINALSFKVDASDEEIEQLKARNDLATRRELVEVTETLKADVLRLTDRIVRGESVVQVAKRDFDAMREELVDAMEPLRREVRLLNARTARIESRELQGGATAATRQELAEAIEPLVQRLAQLSEEKAGHDVHEVKTDELEMRKAGSKATNDEIKTEHEVQVASDTERVHRELPREIRSAVAELSDTAELLKLELKALAEKASHQELEEAVRNLQTELESSMIGHATAVAQAAVAAHTRGLADDTAPAVETATRQELVETTQQLKQELSALSERVARGASRPELQEATALLGEVQDANRLLRTELRLASATGDAAAATRQELAETRELLKQEHRTLAQKISRHEACAFVTTPATVSPGTSGVSKQEFVDATGMLQQELELIARRLDLANIDHSNENRTGATVTRQELADAMQLLRQEVPLLVQKAAKSDDVVKRQELIDAAEILKRELRMFTEKAPQTKGAVTQQQLTEAIESLRREPQTAPEGQMMAGLNSPLLQVAECHKAVSEAVAAAERAERCADRCTERAERESTVAEIDRKSFERHLLEAEERLQARCLADISRLTDNQRRDLDSVERRLRQQLQLHAYKSGMLDGTQRFKAEDWDQSVADTLLGRIGSICERLSTLEGAVVGLGGGSTSNRESKGLEVKTRGSQDSFFLTPSKESLSLGLDSSRQLESSVLDLRARISSVEESCSDISQLANRLGTLEAKLSGDYAASPVRKRTASGDESGKIQLPIQLVRRASDCEDGRGHGELPSDQLEDLYKKIDKLSDEVKGASSESPSQRGAPLADGVAQLLAEVKKTQAQESGVVEALLLRVSSLCDRISAAEDGLKQATAGAAQEVVEKIVAATVGELSSSAADGKSTDVEVSGTESASVASVLDERIASTVKSRLAWELEESTSVASTLDERIASTVSSRVARELEESDSVASVLDDRIKSAAKSCVAWELEEAQLGEQLEEVSTIAGNLEVLQGDLQDLKERMEAVESLRSSRPSLGGRRATFVPEKPAMQEAPVYQGKRKTVADMLLQP